MQPRRRKTCKTIRWWTTITSKCRCRCTTKVVPICTKWCLKLSITLPWAISTCIPKWCRITTDSSRIPPKIKETKTRVATLANRVIWTISSSSNSTIPSIWCQTKWECKDRLKLWVSTLLDLKWCRRIWCLSIHTSSKWWASNRWSRCLWPWTSKASSTTLSNRTHSTKCWIRILNLTLQWACSHKWWCSSIWWTPRSKAMLRSKWATDSTMELSPLKVKSRKKIKSDTRRRKLTTWTVNF